MMYANVGTYGYEPQLNEANRSPKSQNYNHYVILNETEVVDLYAFLEKQSKVLDKETEEIKHIREGLYWKVKCIKSREL